MWVARYILQRLAEKYGIDIEYHCKPLGNTDWKGLRHARQFLHHLPAQEGGKDYFEKLMTAFDKAKEDHIPFMVRTITCGSPTCTKLNLSTCSATGSLTEAHQSAYRTVS